MTGLRCQGLANHDTGGRPGVRHRDRAHPCDHFEIASHRLIGEVELVGGAPNPGTRSDDGVCPGLPVRMPFERWRSNVHALLAGG